MDVAIVTGADTRFGDAVCRTLLKMGFRIHALGHNPDPSGYDDRYYVPHPYGPGRLAELKGALEDALEAEGRLDLLVGLGGPEVVTGWEASTPEALVRRLHGCLTEPLLAASVCLDALRKSKGFLIHGHRRPVAKDLSICPGYFEDSMKKAYDDLFIRNASSGLRSARILYADPEEEADDHPIHQDVAESVSKGFEVILRQKETCVIREISITPRGLGPVGTFPNLSVAVDPYQTSVLPEGESETEEPILIPTEKPKHYVQIAEVKDITEGDVEVEDYYEDEQADELDRPQKPSRDEQDSESSSKPNSSKRRRRSRGRSRRSRDEGESKPKDQKDASAPDESSTPQKKEEVERTDTGGDSETKPKPRPRRNRSKKTETTPATEIAGTEEATVRKPAAKKSTRKKASTPRKRTPKKKVDSPSDEKSSPNKELPEKDSASE